MNAQQAQAEYEKRLATDPQFREIEEYLNYCFAQDGVVRTPYWEKWRGTALCPPSIRINKTRRPPNRTRELVCVETGEFFPSVEAMALKTKLKRNTIYSKIAKGQTLRGKTYRYIEKETSTR